MRYLLDTNICVPFLNGSDKSILAQIQTLGPSRLRLCTVVQAELLYGARKSAKVEANLQRLQELFELLESLDFDRLAAEHYGAIRAQLERGGTPIGAADLMIASIAVAHNLILVTRNLREFQRVEGLELTAWQ